MRMGADETHRVVSGPELGEVEAQVSRLIDQGWEPTGASEIVCIAGADLDREHHRGDARRNYFFAPVALHPVDESPTQHRYP